MYSRPSSKKKLINKKLIYYWEKEKDKMHTVNECAKKLVNLILNKKGRKYIANAKFAY